MRILISNDDGINADGIKVLEEIVADFAEEIFVVAPSLNMSGTGHSVTLQTPLRIEKYDSNHYAINGTPTDSVIIGVREILSKKPDFIFSGINCDANLAEDLTYSGTVGAAMEGTFLDIPSIAFSQKIKKDGTIDWNIARTWAPKVLRIILEKFKFLHNIFLNINFPAVEIEDVKGIRITKQGTRIIDDVDVVVKAIDPRGEPYLWRGPALYRHNNANTDIETDLGAINAGYISITPISLDITAYSEIEKLKGVLE